MRKDFCFYAGKREGLATVEIEFDEIKNTFSANAYSRHCLGQGFDHLLSAMKEQKIPISPTFLKIYNLWKRWHLNDKIPADVVSEIKALINAGKFSE